jgi:hypothetical protein
VSSWSIELLRLWLLPVKIFSVLLLKNEVSYTHFKKYSENKM